MPILEFMTEQTAEQSAGMLSKSEEIQFFADLLSRCPDGYVRDILGSIQPEVERSIRNDLIDIRIDIQVEIGELQNEREQIRDTVERLKSERDSIRNELNRALRDIARAERLREELKKTVQSIRDL